MSYFRNIQLDTDNAAGDAFGRVRISGPFTAFDSKVLFDKCPLIWDESLESGAGITSAHDPNEAAVTFTSTVSTAGKFTRQTFMRFNYQSGKSNLVILTGNISLSGGGTGVQNRIGQFDDNNGLFFEHDEGTMKVVQRSKVTGSVVDTKIAQTSWNVDVLDGTGVSGITIDWTKSQIFFIDYEWLSVGRVRFGVVINGVTRYVHEFLNANANVGAYMSTPNLPLRYQMETTASSVASTMSCICSTVISEGGIRDIGVLRHKSTGSTHVDANSVGTTYAVIGLRLKTAYVGTVVKLVQMSVLSETSDDFEWSIIFNPTVAGAFTYSDETNSSVQTATGALANTVTGGTVLSGGYANAQSGEIVALENSLYLGAAIDGTVDEIVLCVSPLSSNADIQGSLTWRELS